MQNLARLDLKEILQQIEKLATSEQAKSKITKLSQLSSQQAASLSFTQIEEAILLLAAGPRPFMESLDLFSTWYERLKKHAVLKPLEIRDVRHFCLEALALREVLSLHRSSWLRSVYENLMDASEPLSAIEQILTPSGDIRMDASEKLHNLYREKESVERQIRNTLDKYVRDHDMENLLQDKYVTSREGRWVLPVKSGMQHFMEGVIHASSATKQTVFMEPESIIPLNNRQRQIEVEMEEEIERLLMELSHYLSSRGPDFAQSRELLEQMDIRLAQAQFSASVQAHRPKWSENYISLQNVRHPSLVLSGQKVISNTVSLDQKKSILLLSGPNAGGKTVLLKSVGLACQMARSGLLICADEESELPFFENMIVAIGDSQSVDENLSTFAAHLKLLNEATQLKGPKQLLLLDEICGSTDPEEGSALARSFIETYAENQVFAVVTSHLGPLKIGWKEDSHVVNGSLEYDSQTGRPTYQFLMGIPGESLALQTARRVGVNQKVLDRALQNLTPAMRARQEGLAEIEGLKADIQSFKQDLNRQMKEAQAQKKKYDHLIEQFDKEKEDWLKKSVRKAEKKLDEMVTHAKVSEVFKKHSSAVQNIKDQFPEVVKLQPTLQAGGVIKSADEFAERFPPGSKVYVSSLGQDGLVQSTPNSKGEVTILSNSIRVSVSWQDLRAPQKAANPTAQIVRQSTPFTVALQEGDRNLDVRGMSSEEAISQLEMTLDQATKNQEDRIKIVHGYGTEVLKKSVRAYLSRSVYVKKWKAGSPETGGDGVTWVELVTD